MLMVLVTSSTVSCGTFVIDSRNEGENVHAVALMTMGAVAAEMAELIDDAEQESPVKVAYAIHALPVYLLQLVEALRSTQADCASSCAWLGENAGCGVEDEFGTCEVGPRVPHGMIRQSTPRDVFTVMVPVALSLIHS